MGRSTHTPDPSGLGRYADATGRARELVLHGTPRRTLLVVDQLLGGQDPRLVAELGTEEPASNAMLVCTHYLADPEQRWCRPLTVEDLQSVPAPPAALAIPSAELVGPAGLRYRLELVAGPPRCPRELRWVRRPPVGHSGPVQVISLRRAVAALESYEPARAMTAEAMACARAAGHPSTASLAAELARLSTSPIVLNRLLRGAVLGAVRDGQSLSSIAMRCGRVKRDRRGNLSGETSWLGRRLGLLPEGGCRRPTPWIHSDVLALVARRGLGISPREVELG